MRKILQIIGNAASNADLLNDNCIGHSHSVVTSSIVSNTSHFSDPQKLLQTLLGNGSSAAQLYLAKHTWLCFHSKRSKPGGHTFPVAPQKMPLCPTFQTAFTFMVGTTAAQVFSSATALFNATLIVGLYKTYYFTRFARSLDSENIILIVLNTRFLDVEKFRKMSRILSNAWEKRQKIRMTFVTKR